MPRHGIYADDWRCGELRAHAAAFRRRNLKFREDHPSSWVSVFERTTSSIRRCHRNSMSSATQPSPGSPRQPLAREMQAVKEESSRSEPLLSGPVPDPDGLRLVSARAGAAPVELWRINGEASAGGRQCALCSPGFEMDCEPYIGRIVGRTHPLTNSLPSDMVKSMPRVRISQGHQ